MRLIKDCNQGVTLHAESDSESLIFILKMDSKDNRFNPEFCSALSSALDFILDREIPKHPTSKFALIVTGSGKFFSNGLDLKYLISTPDPNQFLIDHYEPLLYKFLSFGIPTISLINGHAFAGGMCFALAQDYRVSSSSCKALLSMNELLIRAAVPAGMLAVLRAKLASPQILRECVYARRWTVHEAYADKIIDTILTNENVMAETVLFAKSKAVTSEYIPVLHAIKQETYREASNLLLDPKSDKLDPFRFAISQNNKL